MNRIKEVLEQKGIKQTWLAEKLGKSYNMVNAYSQNRQQPRLETLMEIAEILDIDVKDLIISNKPEQESKWNEPNIFQKIEQWFIASSIWPLIKKWILPDEINRNKT